MNQHTLTYEEFKHRHYQERGRRIKQVAKEKRERGEITGAVPLGYIIEKTDAGRFARIDEAIAPLIRKAFELAAQDNMPLRKALKQLTDDGLRSRNGKPLGVSGLWYLLTNLFYAGFVRHNGELIQGRHEPLINAEIFKKVQEKLKQRRKLLPGSQFGFEGHSYE